MTGIKMTRESTPPSILGGKLLFQGEDGWAMYDWNKEESSVSRDNLAGAESFLVHVCPTGDRVVREVYIFPDTHKACWRCQAPLPDGMRALWIMHNEKI